MPRIAMLTSGPTSPTATEAELHEYRMLALRVFTELTRDDGFLGHSRDVMGGHQGWGTWTIPEVYDTPEYRNSVIQTLSLWRDFESLHAFSYNGSHRKALQRSREWFPRFAWRNHVIWWVDDDHQPTWAEGVPRFNQLRTEGSSPAAFDFGQLYAADGQPVTINREIVRDKARLYE